MVPQASIVITTKNRRDDLEKAVASALAQRIDGGVEVIVIDDGCTDGTSEMIAEKFPQVVLHRFEQSRGLVVQRNFGARVASAPFIFSIDDDAILTTPSIVADIVAQFDQPNIGAVAIPFINVCQDPAHILQKAPNDSSSYVCPTYIGTAHALRRDVFLRLGGYRESLYHQGEEGDYCVRMLAAGYVVRIGRSDPIHHFESPRRDFRRVDIYGRRNNVLFGWHYVPGPLLPAYLAMTTLHGLRHGVAVRRPWRMIEGLAFGYGAIWSERRQRAPVPSAIFRIYRDLVRRQVVPYVEIARNLENVRPQPEQGPGPGSAATTIPAVTVMIATKNRLEELRRTCATLRRLDPPPAEILITADGCTDGTVEYIRKEMPAARLIVNPQSRGSTASRDRMIREACGEFILSLDDDSYPEQSDCLARITSLFAQQSRAAVLHFPQRTDEYPATLGNFDFGPPRVTRSFSNAGAVLRRSVYLRLRGFDPFFFHAYEEPDYALQCVSAGHEIFYEPSITIRHHYSGTARNEMRTHQRHARNEFWSTLMRVPFPYAAPVAAYRALSQLHYASTRGVSWIVREPVWWVQALAGIPHSLRARAPVHWNEYRSWLSLPDVGIESSEASAELRRTSAPLETLL